MADAFRNLAALGIPSPVDAVNQRAMSQRLMPHQHSLSAAPPSLRADVQDYLARSLFGDDYGRSGYRSTGRMMDAAGATFAAPVEAGLLAYDAGVDYAAGNPGQAAAGLGMAALGIPGSAAGRAAMRQADAATGGAVAAARPAGAGTDFTRSTLVRYMPPKGASARSQNLMGRIESNPALLAEIKSIATDGETIGREWYKTDNLRQRFIDELGPKSGHEAFIEYINLVGATSTGSKVPPNIRNASYYFVEQGNNGMFNDPAMQEALKKGEFLPPKGSGYGHKMQRNQAANVGKYYGGDWDTATADPRVNPKPRGFVQSLLGGERNIAADKHFTRLMAQLSDDPEFLHGSAEISQDLYGRMVDQFGKSAVDRYVTVRSVNGKPALNFNAKAAVLGSKATKDRKGRRPIKGMYDFIRKEASVWEDQPNDNEYAVFERMANEIAEQMGMTAPQFQAALWMGGAKRTGVDPTSLDTFENLFNANLAEKAAERGLSEDEVFRRFARRVQPLAVPGLLGTGAASGMMGGGEDERVY